MCPYCGTRYEHTSDLDQKLHIGNPFLRCSHCGKEFIDKDCFELETANLKLQKELLVEAVLYDLTKSSNGGTFSRIKFKGEAKRIVESGGLISNDILCESLLRTLNQEYVERLKSIQYEYNPLDKSRFFYPKYNMKLNDYIEKYINEDGSYKDSSLGFKKGYYF